MLLDVTKNTLKANWQVSCPRHEGAASIGMCHSCIHFMGAVHKVAKQDGFGRHFSQEIHRPNPVAQPLMVNCNYKREGKNYYINEEGLAMLADINLHWCKIKEAYNEIKNIKNPTDSEKSFLKWLSGNIL